MTACGDSQPGNIAADCDRQCLLEAADAYLAALTAGDPAQAPLAPGMVFVENLVRLSPGEGLWQSVTEGPERFIVRVPDEINQSVGLIAMMRYRGPAMGPQGLSPEEREDYGNNNPPEEQPVIVGMRLQFDGQGRITEAEHLLSGVREPQLANLQEPRPSIFREIPADRRLSHEDLIAIGEAYYDALDDNDGELAPFAPSCQRHENGMITASPDPSPTAAAIPGTAATPALPRDCRRQLSTGLFQYIDKIEHRRVFAADPQTGLVMGLSHFRHPMDNLPYLVTHPDGTTSERNQENLNMAPFDLPAAHIYKVNEEGLIDEIEAMGFTTRYNSLTGWE